MPSDSDEPSGLREETFTARTSAANLLAIVATSRGPGRRAAGGQSAREVKGKRKKSAVARKQSNAERCAGADVLQLLEQVPMPGPADSFEHTAVCQFYGALMAYGACAKYLKAVPASTVTQLIHQRVVPLYAHLANPSPNHLSPNSARPYLLASANWVLGELAEVLEDAGVGQAAHAALLSALTWQSPGDTEGTLTPVRASAAAAITTLLQASCWPDDWSPLLTAAVETCGAPDEEAACRSFALLEVITEVTTGAEEVSPVLVHAVTLVDRMVHALVARMQPPPQPLDDRVQRGFAAVAALVHALRTAHEERAEEAEAEGKEAEAEAGMAVSGGDAAVALPPYELLVPAVVALLSQVHTR